jgi:hypothetical protein
MGTARVPPAPASHPRLKGGPPQPVVPPTRGLAEWFARRRAITLSLAGLLRAAVVFFAVNPDALANVLSMAAAGLMIWYGIKPTFAQPTGRGRSRSRRRR